MSYPCVQNIDLKDQNFGTMFHLITVIKCYQELNRTHSILYEYDKSFEIMALQTPSFLLKAYMK